jgi:hypothetical protein
MTLHVQRFLRTIILSLIFTLLQPLFHTRSYAAGNETFINNVGQTLKQVQVLAQELGPAGIALGATIAVTAITYETLYKHIKNQDNSIIIPAQRLETNIDTIGFDAGLRVTSCDASLGNVTRKQEPYNPAQKYAEMPDCLHYKPTVIVHVPEAKPIVKQISHVQNCVPVVSCAEKVTGVQIFESSTIEKTIQSDKAKIIFNSQSLSKSIEAQAQRDLYTKIPMETNFRIIKQILA